MTIKISLTHATIELDTLYSEAKAPATLRRLADLVAALTEKRDEREQGEQGDEEQD